MINTKKLVELATKLIINTTDRDTSVACRGHIFVHTIDGKRFMVPLKYLVSNIFVELFRMSEEEFGLPSEGPITIPCDAACMKYIISLLRRRTSVDAERAILSSLEKSGHKPQQLILYGY